MKEKEEFDKIKNSSSNIKPKKNYKDNDDNLLLKLHKQFTKDDVLLASSRRLSELKVELGQWKSYAEELEDKISKLKLSKSKFENIVREATNKEVKTFKKEFKALKQENIELKDYVDVLLKRSS